MSKLTAQEQFARELAKAIRDAFKKKGTVG